MLRDEDLVRLQGARLAVATLRDIEDDCMSVQLRRRIAIDGPGCIVLEGRRDELARRLRRVDIAYTGLSVAFQFSQRRTHTLPVGQSHLVVAAYQRSQRYRFGRGERRIPPSAMFGTRDLLAELALVSSRNLVPDTGPISPRKTCGFDTRRIFRGSRNIRSTWTFLDTDLCSLPR